MSLIHLSGQIAALQDIIAANQAAQKQARNLNIRAGKVIFTVLSRTEWDERLKPLLAGARGAVEIPNLEALRLPPLDPAKVSEVFNGNPDTITLPGFPAPLRVEYGISEPTILVSYTTENMRLLLALPDAPVALPNGRLVKIQMKWSYYDSIGDTDIVKVKAAVAKQLNNGQWDNWQKPSLALPNLETETFPEMVTAEYGVCQATGKPLKAFGAVYVYSYWNSKELRSQWYRDQTEAQGAHQQAKTHFEGLLVKAREDKARKAAWETAAPIRAKAESLRMSDEFGWGKDEEVQRKLNQLSYETPSSSATPQEIDAFRQRVETVVAEAEAVLAQREEAKRLAEAENNRAAEVQAFASDKDDPEAYVLATEDGRLYVHCGKASKMGKVTVEPALGEKVSLIYTPTTDSKACMWWEIPAGKKVHFVDYAGSGSVNTESTFYLEAGQLAPGVWVVTYDNDGNYFYPVIYYKEGKRILPDKLVTVDEREAPAEEVKTAGMSELLKKFGDPHAGKKK